MLEVFCIYLKLIHIKTNLSDYILLFCKASNINKTTTATCKAIFVEITHVNFV